MKNGGMSKMVSPREEKISIKNKIIGSINEHGKVEKAVVIAGLKLETGFGQKVIEEIIDDLVIVGVIEIKGDMIMMKQEKDE